MDFVSRITQSPRPFDPERGDEIATSFDGVDTALKEVLVGTGGSSPFLHGLMLRETDWLRTALISAPEAVFTDLMREVSVLELKSLSDGLRIAKRRVALLTGLADLAGVWELNEVTRALTDFADLAVDRSVKLLVAAEIDRGKLPGAGDADKETAGGMAVLAMGKMGAHELNYSSDIDLICVFDESRFEADDFSDARRSFVRVTRKMCALLSDLTGEGYVFRTDLRLRPDPSVTPVCLSMGAAEGYYESVGRTWERAAHIKARICAGDIAAGDAYLERLTPFVWRKHLDFAAIQDAHDMRLRIREHKGLHGPITLEGHNMKLGAGGIREIEFFTQTRQIIAGGRDRDLRVRGTLEGLDRLAEKGWVGADEADVLKEDYVFHRTIEHRLQIVADAQTHDLPKTDDGFARLAALCGREVAPLRKDIGDRLSRVFAITEGFFAPDDEATPETEMSDAMRETIERWRNYPSLRSARAGEIFERLKPEFIRRLQQAAHPDEALIQFDAFLAGLPSGVQVFSMFEANAQLIDLIVDIAGSAPRLAQYLGRNSQVFDAVIGGDFFSDWPGSDVLCRSLSDLLQTAPDYEAKLDQARRFMKEWHFRIGVHHLRGLIDAPTVGAQYADLAGAILQSVWPVVVAEFEKKHGPPPGRGAAVLGMGSLGSRQLNAASDLDIIVIYDADGVEQSEGRRALATRPYYARLTQAMVTAISAPMSEGRLYEVDMRLRPSGRQGPVATSLEAFTSYQESEAWTWEHLALSRARFVAGNSDLGAKIEAIRRRIISKRRDVSATLQDVAEMRTRLAEAKPARNAWDVKNGAGRLQDIELLAQTCALLSGSAKRSVADQIASGLAIGWLSSGEADTVCATHALFWKVQSGLRLLGSGDVGPDEIGQGGIAFLLRRAGAENWDGLLALLDKSTQDCAEIINSALGRTFVQS